MLRNFICIIEGFYVISGIKIPYSMIQEIKIRNFKSFRDEAELSFEPSGDDRYNNYVTMPTE